MMEHWTFLIEKQTKMVNNIVEQKAKLLYVYSGHDTSIATILGSLKVPLSILPFLIQFLSFFTHFFCQGIQRACASVRFGRSLGAVQAGGREALCADCLQE